MTSKYQISNNKDQTGTSPRFDLEERVVYFSRQVIQFCKSVGQTAITRPLISQLVRAVTSIGANYHEANNASSKKDFRNKLYIAKKEAQETCYWLNVFEELAQSESIKPLRQEATELTKILQTIIKKAEA